MSPPYAQAVTGGEYSDKRTDRLIKAGYDPQPFTSEGRIGGQGKVDWQYSKSVNNIGNLPYGEIDKVTGQ